MAAFTVEQARRVFDCVIRPNCEVWVGTLDERVVAYLAMKRTYIDRLYVDPPEWRKGWGTQLVKYPHLDSNSIRIKRTSLRVCFTNVTDSGQSNSASVRRQNLRPILSTIGVLDSPHPADAPRPIEATDSDPVPLRPAPR
jgi:hypothetical protein